MSKIEWTEETWNPVVGCSVVSPGCTNCYAMKMAARLERMGVPHYAGMTKDSKAGAVWTGTLAFAPEKILTAPLRRRKPTTYFVNSMGDLFHEDAPDAWIDKVFAVMALAHDHTFQVLTKRAKRMREYMANPERAKHIWRAVNELVDAWADGTLKARLPCLDDDPMLAALSAHGATWGGDMPWPLKNVWLAVSAERQQEADARIPELLATPAAVRFVSIEPLLGPIDLNGLHYVFDGGLGHAWESALNGKRFDAWSDGDIDGMPRLDWVIVGGESGTAARPMHPDWARSLRNQCTAAQVPFFFKQWGEWVSVSEVEGPGAHHVFPDHASVRRVGKARAGRLLDGREWNEMPGGERP